jgi:beta-glucosidase/6-phospho-beta-glucosidase/beta-galactosidase
MEPSAVYHRKCCSLAGEPGLERELDDLGRIRYLRAIFSCATAIQRGVNLKGYYVWSLL